MSTNPDPSGPQYWDPQESTKTKWEITYASELQSRGLTQDFTGLSTLLLGQAQPKQFQRYDDEQPTGWRWNSIISDDGSYATLDTATINANTEIPRSINVGDKLSLGNLYNWFAATAESGTYTMTSGSASDSICPSGWDLVHSWGTLLKDTYNFADVPGSTQPTDNPSQKVRRLPVALVLSGYYDFNSGSVWARNSSGMSYWAWKSQNFTHAYGADVSVNTWFSAPATLAKTYGLAVRCVQVNQ